MASDLVPATTAEIVVPFLWVTGFILLCKLVHDVIVVAPWLPESYRKSRGYSE